MAASRPSGFIRVVGGRLAAMPEIVPKPKPLAYWLIAVGFVLVSVFEVFALFYWGRGSGTSKLGALSALVGFYGLGLGAFSARKKLGAFTHIRAGLTDPDPVSYLIANLDLGATLMQFGVLGLRNRTERGAPPILSALGLFLWIPVALLLVAYLFFHLLVLMFVAYLPIVTAAAVVTRLAYASGDILIRVGDVEVSVKGAVREDLEALKGFAVGVPGLGLAIVSTLLGVISRGS